MKKRKPQHSRAPQNVSKVFWYYEEPNGLCCIFQPRDAAGNLLFSWPAFTIPWRMIERSVARHQAVKRRGKSYAKV